MCKYCAKNKVKPVIFSSGMFPDEEMIKKLAPHIKSIHTTVKYPDTMDAAWKGHKLAHENMKKLLETCHKLKVKTYIHFCVDQNNIKYFDEMKVFMKEHNATGMHILRFLAYHKDDISLTLSDDEWEEFCLHVVNNKDDLKIDIMYPSKQSYDICVAGATRINILTNGDVTGCIYIAKPIIGNIIVEDYPAIEKRLAKFREKYGKNTPCIARVECDFSFKK
jgi:MoaA/NifB/PqqE/SkfB family radical SAM enzyme